MKTDRDHHARDIAILVKHFGREYIAANNVPDNYMSMRLYLAGARGLAREMRKSRIEAALDSMIQDLGEENER